MPHTFSHGYALLIGVGEIDEYPKWSLAATVSDMKGLHALLIDPARCAYPDNREHVRLLHDQTATRQSILDGLDWLTACATQDPDATIVVSYSGHGWLDQETARYYLIPYDVDPFDLPRSALAADDFQAALRAMPAKRLLVFIDSCHAEGMAAAKETVPIKLPHGFAPHAPPPTLLEALQTGAGRAVFTSSRGDQQSWVRADGTLSVFTHHLLEALQGAANQPGDTVVRLSHLMNHLNRAVSETALRMFNAEQVPFMSIASEDFPVALIQGGKGMPVGGWPAVAQEAQQTIERLSHVQGDHNVIGDVSGDIVQLGDNQVATSGGDYIAGDKNEIQAEHYYEQITVGEDKPTQLAAARSDYLKRLRNRLQVLPMAAIGGEDSLRDAVRLDQVYVELDTLSPVMGHDESEAVRSQVGAFGETHQALSAMEAATQEARLALLGDPGSGKSTFVKQLAAWLASAGLDERDPPDGWSADLLPILTNLRDLAPHLTELALNDLSSDERNQRIIAVLYQQWRADVESLPMPADWVLEVLDGALTSGAAMVVFDGLDEVPEATRIRVGWMLNALLATYPDIAHVIVTCRIRSYVGNAVLPNFGDHRLAPFADEKIRRFAECWYFAQADLQGLTPDVAAARASDLIQAALSKELRELAENPLLVTAMAIIHQREVGLPEGTRALVRRGRHRALASLAAPSWPTRQRVIGRRAGRRPQDAHDHGAHRPRRPSARAK